jgi:hypothetical protein
MEITAPLEITKIRFTAGSHEDPRPESNPLERRFARCMNCNIIVHFSVVLKKWVDDSGRYHSTHTLEFPAEWLTRDGSGDKWK